MSKAKEVSDHFRKRIIELHGEVQLFAIEVQLFVPLATVDFATTINLARSGAPIKINARGRRILLGKVKNNQMITRKELRNGLEAAGTSVSNRTISRELHSSNIKSFQPLKTPMLNKKHMASRLKFARDYLGKGNEFWNSIIWSDETKFKVLGQTQLVTC